MTIAVDTSPQGRPVPTAAAPADSQSSVLSRILLGLVLVVIALGLVAISREMPARTAKGSAVLSGLAALQANLATHPTANLAGPDAFTKISAVLPYAVVLGGRDRWLQAMAAADGDDAPAQEVDQPVEHLRLLRAVGDGWRGLQPVVGDDQVVAQVKPRAQYRLRIHAASLAQPQGPVAGEVDVLQQRSLEQIKRIREAGKRTKTGIMLGIGETKEEVFKAMDDLAANGLIILTLGQYLQPTKMHLEVAEFIHPDVFAMYKEEGLKRGIKYVESGPLVRSSYHAERHVNVPF